MVIIVHEEEEEEDSNPGYNYLVQKLDIKRIIYSSIATTTFPRYLPIKTFSSHPSDPPYITDRIKRPQHPHNQAYLPNTNTPQAT